MGIFGLMKVVSEKAPGAIKETEMKNLFGRKVAIDASMSIYQFLIAMKGALGGEGELLNQHGEVTSHLQGMWSRTIRMVQQGLRPVYVFDGAPPKLKSLTLESRKAKVADASESLAQMKEDGDKEEMLKLQKRTVRATREQTEECKRLLTLMGIPVVQATGEAEATCAALVKAGKCWATGTEDMDALTFGTPRLLRYLTFSEAKKQPILEITLERVLEGMGLEMDQFVDMCILLGCDYCPRIPGVGPVKAYDGIKSSKNLENFLKHLDTTKYKLPEIYPFDEVRGLFHKPDVTDPETVDTTMRLPDTEGLIKFLVDEKGFSRERVESGIKKLIESKERKTQGRLDEFFTPQASPAPKRPREEPTKGSGAKRQKVGGKMAGKRAVVSSKK
eukprot:TRINITY_DN30783_c0_g1_i1.p1 TRINITY_DN30783_c0_g1~~TRINITY_DN30783_c0_g1_i1.p1  ORF type:complete len:389 (-),score=59.42 TRINITY_DN30783_c0_g1_i1:94-1260(-)